jgi:shikimate kinase
MTDSTSLLPDAPPEVLDEVAKEYEQTLVIPDHTHSPQWMLLPVGMVGSGKTTVVKALAEHFGLVRISTDGLRERLKNRGYSYEGARDISHDLTKKYLQLGHSVAIDANTGSKFGIEHARKIREAFPQVRYVYIHSNPPESFILANLRNSDKPWLYRDAQHAIDSFHVHKETYAVPDMPFVYTFDPARGDFTKQLSEGIAAIESFLLLP